VRANGTGRCDARIKLDSVSAAILAWPRRFPAGQKACGGGPTTGCKSKPSRPRCSPTKLREQAFGEALDADKLEQLGRYEVHLDRKLERMLTMLLRLKDLRQGATEG
jgi:hypothetical protein